MRICQLSDRMRIAQHVLAVVLVITGPMIVHSIPFELAQYAHLLHRRFTVSRMDDVYLLKYRMGLQKTLHPSVNLVNVATCL